MFCSCCDSTNKPPQRLACPVCQQSAEAVSTTTLLHQLTTPWRQSLSGRQYYFCQHPGCELVYFDSEGSRFDSEALRQPVGQKSTDESRKICYCFDIRHSDLAEAEAAKQCRDFVIEKTRSKLCSCETHNPSGCCCLRDFPKQKE